MRQKPVLFLPLMLVGIVCVLAGILKNPLAYAQDGDPEGERDAIVAEDEQNSLGVLVTIAAEDEDEEDADDEDADDEDADEDDADDEDADDDDADDEDGDDEDGDDEDADDEDADDEDGDDEDAEDEDADDEDAEDEDADEDDADEDDADDEDAEEDGDDEDGDDEEEVEREDMDSTQGIHHEVVELEIVIDDGQEMGGELREVVGGIRELQRAQKEVVEQFRHAKAGSDEERHELRARLTDLLHQEFELRQRKQALNTERLERRLEQIRAMSAKREEHKELIIENRLADMIGGAAILRWDADERQVDALKADVIYRSHAEELDARQGHFQYEKSKGEAQRVLAQADRQRDIEQHIQRTLRLKQKEFSDRQSAELKNGEFIIVELRDRLEEVEQARQKLQKEEKVLKLKAEELKRKAEERKTLVPH